MMFLRKHLHLCQSQIPPWRPLLSFMLCSFPSFQWGKFIFLNSLTKPSGVWPGQHWGIRGYSEGRVPLMVSRQKFTCGPSRPCVQSLDCWAENSLHWVHRVSTWDQAVFVSRQGAPEREVTIVTIEKIIPVGPHLSPNFNLLAEYFWAKGLGTFLCSSGEPGTLWMQGLGTKYLIYLDPFLPLLPGTIQPTPVHHEILA